MWQRERVRAALGKLIREAERVPAKEAESQRCVSHENQIALRGAEPADAADEVFARGHIQRGAAPGDESQVCERLGIDTIMEVAPVRLVERLHSGIPAPH